MLNKIFLQGRLVADPELRHTQSGVAVASFRLAVDRDFKDRETGEQKADFINVVAWRQTAEFVSRYFTKGRMAVVEGRLQMRDYTDRDGNRRHRRRGGGRQRLFRRLPPWTADGGGAPAPQAGRYYSAATGRPRRRSGSYAPSGGVTPRPQRRISSLS